MLLGRKVQFLGETKRYEVDYSGWLDACLGEKISEFGVAVNSGDATIENSGIETDYLRGWFLMDSPSTAQTFSVTVTVSTTRGQVKLDTIEFVVEAP